jgi:hypothetical protein
LVPRNIAFGPETRVFLLLATEGLRNAPKHFQTSFWVQWTRMDASQLWFPEIVHSGPKYEFCTFYTSNVSEMLQNTRKHHFGSNGLEWKLHNFGTPKYCLRARNTSFFIFYLPRVCEMLRNTSKHHFGSNGLEWMLHNFGTAKYCIRARNTSFFIFYLPRVCEMLRNTSIHHFGSNGLEWMLHNFGTPK